MKLIGILDVLYRNNIATRCIQDTLSSRAALGLPLGRVRRASKGILHTLLHVACLFAHACSRARLFVKRGCNVDQEEYQKNYICKYAVTMPTNKSWGIYRNGIPSKDEPAGMWQPKQIKNLILIFCWSYAAQTYNLYTR